MWCVCVWACAWMSVCTGVCVCACLHGRLHVRVCGRACVCVCGRVCVCVTYQCDGEPFLQLCRVWHGQFDRGTPGPDHCQLGLHTLCVTHGSYTHTPSTLLHTRCQPIIAHIHSDAPLKSQLIYPDWQPSTLYSNTPFALMHRLYTPLAVKSHKHEQQAQYFYSL